MNIQACTKCPDILVRFVLQFKVGVLSKLFFAINSQVNSKLIGMLWRIESEQKMITQHL